MITLKSLKMLAMDDNDLTGTIPTIFGRLSLNILSLANNRLTGTIPSELGNLKGVNLYLNGNELRGTIPSELGKSRRIEFLVLNNNQLTGTIPSDIGRLPILQMCEFSQHICIYVYVQFQFRSLFEFFLCFMSCLWFHDEIYIYAYMHIFLCCLFCILNLIYISYIFYFCLHPIFY